MRLILPILALWPLCVSAQPNILVAEPHTTVRSKEFEVRAGQTVTVAPTADNARTFDFQTWIYHKSGRLAALDDDESVTPVFHSKLAQTDSYYAVVRNLSENTGRVAISVDTPMEISRPSPVEPSGVPPAEREDAPYKQVKVFYGTNRAAVTSDAIGAVYGTDPGDGDGVRLGEAIVSVPRYPQHKMGELEGPSIFRLEWTPDPNQHIVVQKVRQESTGEFTDHLRKRIEASEGREALVFVHGYRVEFREALRRTAQMSADLGFDGAPILFSWPSHGTLLGYTRDETNAEESAVPLANFLKFVSERSGARTVHIVAHSMGGRVLSRAMQILSAQGLPAGVGFREVVLMAPDIDAKVFRQLAGNMTREARRVTLYASDKDLALEASRFIAGKGRAGASGTRPLVVPGVETIDASDAKTSPLGAFHQYYADNQTILSDLFYLIRGVPASMRARIHPKHGEDGDYFYIVPAAR